MSSVFPPSFTDLGDDAVAAFSQRRADRDTPGTIGLHGGREVLGSAVGIGDGEGDGATDLVTAAGEGGRAVVAVVRRADGEGRRGEVDTAVVRGLRGIAGGIADLGDDAVAALGQRRADRDTPGTIGLRGSRSFLRRTQRSARSL